MSSANAMGTTIKAIKNHGACIPSSIIYVDITISIQIPLLQLILILYPCRVFCKGEIIDSVINSDDMLVSLS